MNKVTNKSYLTFTVFLVLTSVLYAILKPKSVDINQVALSDVNAPINTTIIGTLLIDAPQGLKGNYYLLDANGNVTILNVDKIIDNLEGKLLKVEGNLYVSSDANTKPYINAINIEISN